MPKRKTDPSFAVAKELQGLEKILYLANGNLNRRASAIVDDVKTWARSKNEYLKKNPYTGSSTKEQRDALLESCEHEMEDAHGLIDAAILSNDGELFRLIAEVLDQHKANR